VSNVILMDGGMGQELVRRSPDALTQLWGGAVLRDHPHIVGGLHEDFLRAGAKALITNSYSLSRPRLARDGQEDMLDLLQNRACEVAIEAIDATGSDVALLGSLPPLNGSYHPDSVPPVEEAAEQFAEIAAIQAPYVDVLLCETMSSIKETQGALVGAARAGKPIWLAFTTDDNDGTKLRSGEPLVDALDAVAGSQNLAAILINCTRPEAVDQGMPILAKCGLPFGAYANGFTRIETNYLPGAKVDELSTRKDLTPEAYAGFAMGWVERGATIVGGCCEVGPAHIAILAQRLQAAGHSIIKDLS